MQFLLSNMACKVFRRRGKMRYQGERSSSYDRKVSLHSPWLESLMKCTSVLPKMIETAKTCKMINAAQCNIRDKITYFHLSDTVIWRKSQSHPISSSAITYNK